jgi:hypothetical protein
MERSLKLGEHLLAAIPRGQVAVSALKRSRAHFICDRRRLERLGCVRCRTVRAGDGQCDPGEVETWPALRVRPVARGSPHC